MPTDPLSTAVSKGIEEASKAAKDYADKLFSPSLQQVGGVLADRLAFWRFRNQVEIILKAKAYLESKGIEPRKVLPRTAVAILEAGSLEHGEEMRDKWVAMLAHAANPAEPELHPGLPRILAEMSDREVKALDQICTVHGYHPHEWGWIPFEVADFYRCCYPEDPGEPTGVVHLENLERLRIVESGRDAEWVGKEQLDTPFLVTRLGFALLDACRFQ